MRRLERLRIAVRLRLVFLCVLLFMLAGSVVSLWYFQSLRERTRQVSEAEQRVTAVVRLNNRLVTLMSRLHRAADRKDSQYFEVEAERRLAEFRSDTAAAVNALQRVSPTTGANRIVVGSYSQMLSGLPDRILQLIQLARSGDWLVLHARLSDQVDHADDVAEALMLEADAGLLQARQLLSENISEAERRASASLAIGSLAALVAASLLGMAVTRSITEPLSKLDVAARALARGDFEHRVALKGSNELANLGEVFDHTAQELSRLYAQVRYSEARLQELLARENEGRKAAELLNRIGRVFSAELDDQRLTQSLTEVATQLISGQFGAFFSNMSPDQALMAYTGAEQNAIEQLRILQSTPLWPSLDRDTVRSEDIRGAFFSPEQGTLDAGQLGVIPITSYLAVSLMSRSRESLGTLVLGHSEASQFSEAGEELIRRVCAQAAIALDNAHLFKRLNSANQALRDSNEALQRANEDLSVFAFSASHDLQEPLRNISLYSQLLQRRYAGKLDAAADEFLKFLVQGAHHMAELIKGLLAYIEASNIAAEHRTSVPAELALERAMSALRTAVSANQATVVTGELPALPVELVHLQQLFQNLIGNAVRYRSEETPKVRISAREVDGYWEFSVSDNGVGIDPQYRNQIFKPFKRLHGRSSHPGSGIGLAICQKIVNHYGGRIWVESEPGKGSEFKFTLPKANHA